MLMADEDEGPKGGLRQHDVPVPVRAEAALRTGAKRR